MTANKSSRRGRRSNTQKQTVTNDVVSMMAPQRASRISDPPVVTDTIQLTKRIQISFPVPDSGSSIISPVALMAGVPGGVTFWRDCRIERIDVFSNSSSEGTDTITVTAAGNASWGQPVSQWIDSGVYGSVRAHVGYRLGLLDRARWFNTADNTPLGAVSSDAGASTLIVQAVVELKSNFIT
jgi:hypothetical protein